MVKEAVIIPNSAHGTRHSALTLHFTASILPRFPFRHKAKGAKHLTRSHACIIVGYSGFTLRSGSIMVNPSFLKVGDGKIARLTDIKPTGYENLAYWKTGKGNGFNDKVTIAILAKNGATATDENTGKQLLWSWKHAKGFANPGYWVRFGETTAIVAGSDEDYQFKPGEAVWADVVAGAYGGSTGASADQYSLQNSGEAMLESGTFTLRSGSIGVGAPLSRAVRLTEIKPTGYENLAYWKTGKGNGFNDKVTIAVLAKNGATAIDEGGKQLLWSWKHAKGFANPGYWVRFGESTKIEPGSADDYQFKLGEAVWADVVAGAYGGSTGAAADQYKLEFPAVEDDNRVTE